MSLNLFKTLKDGHQYMRLWPMVRQLSFYFPEYRVIRATRIAIVFMPALAIAAVISQLYINGSTFIPQAIALALFFVSLPIQGLIWLGVRARNPLPLTLLDWGNKLTDKLTNVGVHCPTLGSKACYLDMALILKTAFERLDANYWEQL